MRRFQSSAVWPRFVLVILFCGLSACGRSEDTSVQARAAAECDAAQFCAGAAKRAVAPSQMHIDGVAEPRFNALERTQKFNLGGFGINPTQNFPNPFGSVGEQLTQPAQEPVYLNREAHPENTWLRVLVLQGPDESGQIRRVAFVVLDAIGAGNIIQERMTAVVNEASCAQGACIEPADVLFGQTHTHAGADLQGLWGGVPEDWIANTLLMAAREAVTAAVSGMKVAKLSIAQGSTGEFNNYRRPRVDPDATADETLSLLRIAPAAGGPLIASLMQYAAHPTSINEDPRIPHSDYILGAAETLEADGGVAIYYNGPIADASGSGGDCSAIAEPNAYDHVRCRGRDLANAARALPTSRELAPLLSTRHVQVALPVTNPLFAAAGSLGSFNRYYNFYPRAVRDIPGLGGVLDTSATEIALVAVTADTNVSRLTLGGSQGLEIVTIPGEATNTFGQTIRSLADPAAQVMLFGLTHNSFGYIIPEEEFNYIDPSGDDGFTAPFTGYEEFVSMGPLTAPLLRTQAYGPLFDLDPASQPPYLAACSDPLSEDCLINIVAQKVDYMQRAYAQQCLEAGAPEAFCTMLNPDTPLNGPCREAGLPSGICDAFGPRPPPAE